MTNKERIIADAKAHRAGANAHTFGTAFDWKKAGFCPRPSAIPKFTSRLCFKTPKGFIWKDEPIYRDDQVCTPEEYEKWVAFASAPKREAKPVSAKKPEALHIAAPKNALEIERHYYKLCKDRQHTTSPARKIAYALASELRARRLATANA